MQLFSALASVEVPGGDAHYATLWDETDKDLFKINRGGWNVTRAGDSQTLLIFTVQIELKDYPDFVVRNIIMDRIPTLVKAMADEGQRRRMTR